MVKELLQPDSARVAYDIRRDTVGLELMQKASLSNGPGGIELAHGLIGSQEWWSAIETGRLELKTFVGILRSVAGGMHGDTLKVHIEAGDEKQRWVAWRGFEPSLNGKQVRTHYVQMSPKKPLASKPGFLIPVLLQVELLD